MTKTDMIAEALISFLEEEKKAGKTEVSLTALEVGKISNIKNRYPMCVQAMKRVAEQYKTEMIHDVKSGQSSTVEIKYYL